MPQGTYVLQDNKFSLLTQLSNGKQYLDQAPKVSIHEDALLLVSSGTRKWAFAFWSTAKEITPSLIVAKKNLFVCVSSQYLAFSCGVVRGALSNLGLDSVVTAEVSVMPSCKYYQNSNDRLSGRTGRNRTVSVVCQIYEVS